MPEPTDELDGSMFAALQRALEGYEGRKARVYPWGDFAELLREIIREEIAAVLQAEPTDGTVRQFVDPGGQELEAGWSPGPQGLIIAHDDFCHECEKAVAVKRCTCGAPLCATCEHSEAKNRAWHAEQEA